MLTFSLGKNIDFMELTKTASSKINSSLQKDKASFFSFVQDGKGHPPFFQPKLTINQPNDPYEREADAMADKVMRMTAPVIQTKCSGCEEEEEKKVQLKESPDLQKQDVPGTDSLVPAAPVTPAFGIQLPLPSLLRPSTEPDFLAMRQPFFQRNIAHLWDANSALQVWHYNFNFFRRFGLSPDLSASASNFTAPFSIDSQLKAGNPTWWEITDRDLGTSSFTAALPVLDFNADFSPAAPSWFKTIFGGGGNNRVQRKCDECEDEEKKIQLKETGERQNADSKLTDYIGNLNVSGEQLPGEVRSFYEPRFGHDFSAVKIHTGSAAAKSAQSINALAYTTGSNIVFNNGQYAPNTDSGKRLLGHELTHVVQQQAAAPAVVQCDLIDDLRAAAEAAATARLIALANKPVGAPGTFTGHAGCHPNFCQPFASVPGAVADLAWAGPLILAGIATRVNSRVVPLWASYMSRGSAPQNLTSTFGSDFTMSPTTAQTTRFLIGEMRRDVEANRSTIMGGLPVATINFTPRLSAALAAIDNPVHANQMNFNFPSDIAGNIAGGIGKDETSFPIGASPSPFNDSREAAITATLSANVDGSITVIPFIRFNVKDTIDLCPGDCGTLAEQVATVPLSRFEATALAGDIPMIIEFDAPGTELLPFVIPAPAAVPVTGTVTASVLNIRPAPNTLSSPVGSYTSGVVITVLCQTTGAVVQGNNVWYQTNLGFVSARYVSLTGAGVPTVC